MLDSAQSQPRRRALISDDDEFFRVALRTVLLEKNAFAEVIETASFDEAVEKLQTTPSIDVGLFDLNMVGMENWLDLSAVRAEFPEMRLIVVSASRLREDILRSLEVGAHGFVHKGLGIGELSRAVDMICDGHVYVPPFLPENAGASKPLDFNIAQSAVLRCPDAPEDGSAPNDGVSATAQPNGQETLQCSPRQREIIDLLIAGQSNKGMARALNLSEGTIKFHMSAVLRLLGANSRVEAATRAMKLINR